jgi:glutamine synthetase adenylyltransferase
VYALLNKLINWLTVRDGRGDLFEIDTALRPNGNSGFTLVTEFWTYASTSNSAAATPPGPGNAGHDTRHVLF